MAELSPAAQAVLDAFNAAPPDHSIHELPPDCGHYALAAALCAAVDQVVPYGPCGDDCCVTQTKQIRFEFLAIAAELRGITTPKTTQ